MSDKQIAQAPLLNIPVAVSGQFVAYNLPALGDAHLKLSGVVLAGIYAGTVHFWDDPQIVALNKDLAAKLPHADIIPIHRSDGSGDTFLFTQYLSYTTPSWAKDPGFGTRITWPPGTKGQGAVQNAGVVDLCRNVNGSVAYVGISFFDQADAYHLGYAALQNRDGKFVLPSNETFAAAAAGMIDKLPKDARMSLIYGPGANAYPLTNFEYAIVRAVQPSKDVADALAKFLSWVVSPAGGNAPSYLGRVHFIPLPDSVLKASQAQIALIK
jgi:phosphate transport system substrate-binding protein